MTLAPDPAPEETLEDALATGLAQLGLSAFRPGQREAIETLLTTRRLLLVAPTGGGKSLVYQLPALVLPGTTLVISPLVALMHDQVSALAARGIAATYLAATLDGAEIRRRMSLVARGACKLVYAAPERLGAPGFRSLLGDLDCPLVAVDEAHCISEWGHDFRPEYMEIGALVASIAAPRVLACTATATPVVRDEIVARLGLPADTPQLVRGFARPNLSLRAQDVTQAKDRQRAIDAALAEALGKASRAPHSPGRAIVYAPTRRSSEQESERLKRAGWRSVVYHAGLDGDEREAAQHAFMAGDADVVVATNAFGMGIDRADVRAVIHIAPPGSIEAYYQEVGRAGRDGEPALGLLLVSPGDIPLRRRLLELPSEGRTPDPESVRHKWSLFLELLRYAESGSCRHDAILRYFGDEEETLAGCGHCDVCRELADVGDESSTEETALVVRKALSAVARIHARFGLGAAVKLLLGDDDDRLVRSGLDQTRTFGTLKDRSEEWIWRLLRRCITPGWVDFEGSERPVALLTAEGAAVMRGEAPAKLLLPSDAPRRGTGSPGPAQPKRSARDDGALDEGERALFEELRRYRLERARQDSVPPYAVATDRALRDIARLRPSDLETLEQAHGIGPAKVARYGAELLAVVRQTRSADERPKPTSPFPA